MNLGDFVLIFKSSIQGGAYLSNQSQAVIDLVRMSCILLVRMTRAQNLKLK